MFINEDVIDFTRVSGLTNVNKSFWGIATYEKNEEDGYVPDVSNGDDVRIDSLAQIILNPSNVIVEAVESVTTNTDYLDTLKDELSGEMISEIGKSEYFNTSLLLNYVASSTGITETMVENIQTSDGDSLPGVADTWNWLILRTRKPIKRILENTVSVDISTTNTESIEVKMYTTTGISTISDPDAYALNTGFYDSDGVNKTIINNTQVDFDTLIIMFKSTVAVNLTFTDLVILVKSNEYAAEYFRNIEDNSTTSRKYLTNRQKGNPTDNTDTIYDDNGGILKIFDLNDEDGNASYEDAVERVPRD